MKRQAILLSLIITILFNLVFSYSFFYWEERLNERAKEDYLFHEKVVVDAAVKNINTQIIRNLSDLAYIKDTYIRSLSKNQQQHDLLSLWSLFSENQIIYHKIRFIDLTANEIYRIDHDETGSYVV